MTLKYISVCHICLSVHLAEYFNNISMESISNYEITSKNVLKSYTSGSKKHIWTITHFIYLQLTCNYLSKKNKQKKTLHWVCTVYSFKSILFNISLWVKSWVKAVTEMKWDFD